MVLEATTGFILAGAVAALVLIGYGLLIVAGLLPDWLASSSSAVVTF
jgi:hypothetical protein